jgi:hypothetical protein
MLLTGTFNQFRALVPSVENGYFSRLMTMVIRGTNPFNKSYVSSKGTQSLIPRQVGRQLLRVYEQLLNAGEREWSLTEAQKERLGEHLETEYGTLIGLLGENFHSAVVRMAVQIERIAMILTGMRGEAYSQPLPKGKGESSASALPSSLVSAPAFSQEPTASGGAVDDREMSKYNSGLTNEENGELNSPEREEKRRMLSGKMDEAKMSEYDSDAMDGVVFCTDEDYETAEMIGNKILMHMAAAYKMIDGEAQECVPEIKPLDQRKVLFEQLNTTFERCELIREAKTQGISERTAERWNDKWQEKGIVVKVEHGKYKKVG